MTVGLVRTVNHHSLNKSPDDFGIPVPDYTDENVSAKVVKIIQSYTGVVNKNGLAQILIKTE